MKILNIMSFGNVRSIIILCQCMLYWYSFVILVEAFSNARIFLSKLYSIKVSVICTNGFFCHFSSLSADFVGAHKT